MSCIGFRATAQEVYYVVVDGSAAAPSFVAKAKLKPPAAYGLPEALAWYREQVLHVLKEFGAAGCGVKTAEPFAKSKGKGVDVRHNIDGVLMEATSSSRLPCVTGPWATIKSHIDSKAPKAYVEADSFRSVQGWDSLKTEFREALLVGTAALGKIEASR